MARLGERQLVSALPARITLERPGRQRRRSWRYVLSWSAGAEGILLVREWGVAGSERPRRRLRRCARRDECERAVDGCVKRLLQRGYRLH